MDTTMTTVVSPAILQEEPSADTHHRKAPIFSCWSLTAVKSGKAIVTFDHSNHEQCDSPKCSDLASITPRGQDASSSDVKKILIIRDWLDLDNEPEVMQHYLHTCV